MQYSSALFLECVFVINCRGICVVNNNRNNINVRYLLDFKGYKERTNENI